MRWIYRTAPFLAVFWIVLSWHFELKFLLLGVVSVAVVCWIAVRAGIAGRGGVTARMSLRLPLYFLWLSKEVATSTWRVTLKVWSPRPHLRPAVDATPANDMTLLAQAIYANSITLTPGTLSLRVDDERIEVHALDSADITELRGGEMLRQVRRLEGRR